MPRGRKFRLSPTKPKPRLGFSTPPISNGLPTAQTEIQEETENVAGPSTAVMDKPKRCCLICYHEFTSYTLTCNPWESAVTKDFYVALDIPQDTDSVVALPFCPQCHSKVAVMFSLHQQIQSVMQNFNSVRNDLAFTVVNTISKNCRKGPLDLIRMQILERWKDLYKRAKAINSIKVIDPKSALEYLQPRLTVADDFPLDYKTMSLSHAAKQHLAELRKIPATVTTHTSNAGESSSSSGSSVKRGKGKTYDMPVLEPMAKIPTTKIASQTSLITIKTKYGRTATRITKKKPPVFQKSSAPLGSKIKTWTKKFQQPEKYQSVSQHFNPKMVNKKPYKKLANGLWKCNHCQMAYAHKVRVSQHESRCHPQTRPFLCTVCPKGFSAIESLRRHLQGAHNQTMEGFVQCPYCPRSFGRKNAYNNHITTLHKGKKIPDFDKAKEKPDKTIEKVPLPKASPPSPEITDMESESPVSIKSASPKKKPVSVTPITSAIAEVAEPLPNKRRRIVKSFAPIKRARKSNKLVNGGNPTEDSKVTVEKDKEIRPPKEKEENDENDQQNIAPNVPAATELPTPTTPKAEDNKVDEVQLTKSGKSKSKEPVACKVCEKVFANVHALAGHSKSHRKVNVQKKAKKSTSRTAINTEAVAEVSAEDSSHDAIDAVTAAEVPVNNGDITPS